MTSLLFPVILFADIFIKQKQHTDAMKIMGQTQPAKDTIQKIWFTDDKMKMEGEQHSMLMLTDQNVWYLINHQENSITEMPMDIGKMIDKATPKEGKAPDIARDLMKNKMQIDITIKETDETKKIKNWNCTKYIQTMQGPMGPVTTEIWATQDIDIDKSLYDKFMAAMMAKQPGMQQSMAKMVDEMKKIKGVNVQSTTTMEIMGNTIKSSTELIEIDERKAPESVFELPDGYKKKSIN
jgi:hypothetical protein